ncbi:potassium channel family protein [Spirochaeta africana]|nr:potassium channel protein [Spirochaeta africana]
MHRRQTQLHTVSRTTLSQQVAISAFILAAAIAVGTGGYILIEGWSLGDAFYMTMITLTTTGFGEVRPLTPGGRLLTVFVIMSGLASLAYLGGRTVQLLVESYVIRRKRMERKIASLRNHIIVCGFGRMGRHVCEDLASEKAPFVVIENDPEVLEALDHSGYLHLIGDASADEVLRKAQVEHARGLISVVSSDAENVFTTITAKALNPELFVVTRAVNDQTEPKLKTAGADRVIKPYELVGHRLTQLVLRPGIVEYMETVARAHGQDISIEEVVLLENSPLAGKTLAESPLRSELNIIVVAIQQTNGRLLYNPPSSQILQANDRLVAIGELSRLRDLGALCAGPS